MDQQQRLVNSKKSFYEIVYNLITLNGAHTCSHMLTQAHTCSHMLTHRTQELVPEYIQISIIAPIKNMVSEGPRPFH